MKVVEANGLARKEPVVASPEGREEGVQLIDLGEVLSSPQPTVVCFVRNFA